MRARTNRWGRHCIQEDFSTSLPTGTHIFTLCISDAENHDITLRLQAAAHWLSLHCKITVGSCVCKQVTAETHSSVPGGGKTWTCTIPQLPGIHQVCRLKGNRVRLHLFLIWVSGESGLHQLLKSSTANFVQKSPYFERHTLYLCLKTEKAEKACVQTLVYKQV